jgi:hypothetical protein
MITNLPVQHQFPCLLSLSYISYSLTPGEIFGEEEEKLGEQKIEIMSGTLPPFLSLSLMHAC